MSTITNNGGYKPGKQLAPCTCPQNREFFHGYSYLRKGSASALTSTATAGIISPTSAVSASEAYDEPYDPRMPPRLCGKCLGTIMPNNRDLSSLPLGSDPLNQNPHLLSMNALQQHQANTSSGNSIGMRSRTNSTSSLGSALSESSNLSKPTLGSSYTRESALFQLMGDDESQHSHTSSGYQLHGYGGVAKGTGSDNHRHSLGSSTGPHSQSFSVSQGSSPLSDQNNPLSGLKASPILLPHRSQSKLSLEHLRHPPTSSARVDRRASTGSLLTPTSSSTQGTPSSRSSSSAQKDPTSGTGSTVDEEVFEAKQRSPTSTDQTHDHNKAHSHSPFPKPLSLSTLSHSHTHPTPTGTGTSDSTPHSARSFSSSEDDGDSSSTGTITVTPYNGHVLSASFSTDDAHNSQFMPGLNLNSSLSPGPGGRLSFEASPSPTNHTPSPLSAASRKGSFLLGSMGMMKEEDNESDSEESEEEVKTDGKIDMIAEDEDDDDEEEEDDDEDEEDEDSDGSDTVVQDKSGIDHDDDKGVEDDSDDAEEGDSESSSSDGDSEGDSDSDEENDVNRVEGDNNSNQLETRDSSTDKMSDPAVVTSAPKGPVIDYSNQYWYLSPLLPMKFLCVSVPETLHFEKAIALNSINEYADLVMNGHHVDVDDPLIDEIFEPAKKLPTPVKTKKRRVHVQLSEEEQLQQEKALIEKLVHELTEGFGTVDPETSNQVEQAVEQMIDKLLHDEEEARKDKEEELDRQFQDTLNNGGSEVDYEEVLISDELNQTIAPIVVPFDVLLHELIQNHSPIPVIDVICGKRLEETLKRNDNQGVEDGHLPPLLPEIQLVMNLSAYDQDSFSPIDIAKYRAEVLTVLNKHSENDLIRKITLPLSICDRVDTDNQEPIQYPLLYVELTRPDGDISLPMVNLLIKENAQVLSEPVYTPLSAPLDESNDEVKDHDRLGDTVLPLHFTLHLNRDKTLTLLESEDIQTQSSSYITFPVIQTLVEAYPDALCIEDGSSDKEWPIEIMLDTMQVLIDAAYSSANLVDGQGNQQSDRSRHFITTHLPNDPKNPSLSITGNPMFYEALSPTKFIQDPSMVYRGYDNGGVMVTEVTSSHTPSIASLSPYTSEDVEWMMGKTIEQFFKSSNNLSNPEKVQKLLEIARKCDAMKDLFTGHDSREGEGDSNSRRGKGSHSDAVLTNLLDNLSSDPSLAATLLASLVQDGKLLNSLRDQLVSSAEFSEEEGKNILDQIDKLLSLCSTICSSWNSKESDAVEHALASWLHQTLQQPYESSPVMMTSLAVVESLISHMPWLCLKEDEDSGSFKVSNAQVIRAFPVHHAITYHWPLPLIEELMKNAGAHKVDSVFNEHRVIVISKRSKESSPSKADRRKSGIAMEDSSLKGDLTVCLRQALVQLLQESQEKKHNHIKPDDEIALAASTFHFALLVAINDQQLTEHKSEADHAVAPSSGLEVVKTMIAGSKGDESLMELPMFAFKRSSSTHDIDDNEGSLSILPLHMACIAKYPTQTHGLNLLQTLIKADPLARLQVSSPLANHLPLHYAVSYLEHEENILFIIDSYPDAVKEFALLRKHGPNHPIKGYLPYHLLWFNSHQITAITSRVVKKLLDLYPEAFHTAPQGIDDGKKKQPMKKDPKDIYEGVIGYLRYVKNDGSHFHRNSAAKKDVILTVMEYVPMDDIFDHTNPLLLQLLSSSDAMIDLNKHDRVEILLKWFTKRLACLDQLAEQSKHSSKDQAIYRKYRPRLWDGLLIASEMQQPTIAVILANANTKESKHSSSELCQWEDRYGQTAIANVTINGLKDVETIMKPYLLIGGKSLDTSMILYLICYLN